MAETEQPTSLPELGNDIKEKGKNVIPNTGPAASRLPTEVAEQILYLSDPETFASLIITSRLWRAASETPHLFAHHLSRCPSFSATHNVITGPFDDNSLLKLKRLFVQEAKRNLFAVFTRPSQTIIKIISTTTSSSGAFPYGEAFEFTFSAKGHWCLAISSSRIIVIETASEALYVKRELKVVRKPLSAHILQNGQRLAVLSTSHKVNIYGLEEELPRFVRSVELDGSAHALTLSPYGEVLAVAYDGGVEVYSLAESALPTDKRAVKSERVDSLSFSEDGTILLGTTQSSKNPSTVIVSAPYFTETAEDIPQAEVISHMWTSQILFPYSSRDCSHAALLPRKIDHDANWTLTYDRTFESFRAVRTDDLRNGTTYFAGPKPKKARERQRSKSILTPSTLPAITQKGELVAAGFMGSEVWLYGVPEDLDRHTAPNEGSPSMEEYRTIDAVGPSSNHSVEEERKEIDGLPRWQVLVDKYRNVFAKGQRIAKVSSVNQVCWVMGPQSEKGLQCVRERLIIGAPGGVTMNDELEQEEMASLDGGRLIVLDFNWAPEAGESKEITIEVGNAEPQPLPEEDNDMDTEIAIVRRRTIARRDGIPRSQVSSVAEILRPADEPAPPMPPLPTSVGFGLDREASASAPPESPTSSVSPTDGVTLQEAAETFDGPYSHTNPRSRQTLYRSATAVELSRRRTPQIPTSGVVQYRRTDGTELPHESDADNWVPPPPPYTKDPDAPLPDHLRQQLLPRNPSLSGHPSAALGAADRRPRRALSTLEQMSFRRRSSADVERLSRSSSTRWSIQNPRSNDQTSTSGRPDDTISPMSTSLSESPVSSRHADHGTLTPSRRPLSNYEDRSNRSSLCRTALRPASPISSVAEATIQSIIQTSTQPPAQHPATPSTPRSAAGSKKEPTPPGSASRLAAVAPAPLTLSGTNLQQRLDYPLPPPPPGEMSPTTATAVARAQTPDLPSPTRTTGPRTPSAHTSSPPQVSPTSNRSPTSSTAPVPSPRSAPPLPESPPQQAMTSTRAATQPMPATIPSPRANRFTYPAAPSPVPSINNTNAPHAMTHHIPAASTPEPSAYSMNTARFVQSPAPSPPSPLTSPQMPAARPSTPSRLRSLFRSNKDNIAKSTNSSSQPHYRSTSAFNFSTPSLLHRAGASSRMDTIYSVGSQADELANAAMAPRADSRLDNGRPRAPSRQQHQQQQRTPSRPLVQSGTGFEDDGFDVPATATRQKTVSRLTRRLSRLRMRSEDPAQLTRPGTGFGTRVEPEEGRQVQAGYVGRGRRRGRGGMEAEPWEDSFPADGHFGRSASRVIIEGGVYSDDEDGGGGGRRGKWGLGKSKGKRRDGDGEGKCAVM